LPVDVAQVSKPAFQEPNVVEHGALRRVAPRAAAQQVVSRQDNVAPKYSPVRSPHPTQRFSKSTTWH